MSGRKAGKRKRRASEAARSRWSPPSLGTKDVGCQANFFGEEPCLKDTSTVATQTEESTVEVEMVTPISAEKIAVSEVEVCADKDDEMVSVARLQDFLQNSNLPLGKAPTEEPNETEGNEETIRKVEGFLRAKDHDPGELTKKHLTIKQSPLVISTSEILRKSVSESKCDKCSIPGTLKFVKVTEPKTGILKLDFVCSKCDNEFTISTSDEIIPTRTKPKTYITNYILLAFIVCGQYYKDYNHVMGTLGMSHFSEKQWIRVIEWIAPEVEKITNWSVDQARKIIRARGDEKKLEVMFDGFYLTRGHYSNNASATMHDAKTGNIIGYAHRTKRGQGANWEGTSGGAEGNMLDEILADLIGKEKMKITKAVLDKDAACHEVLLSRSPETDIVYCGNHTAKTFHADLEKVKKTPCQVSTRRTSHSVSVRTANFSSSVLAFQILWLCRKCIT